MVKVEVIRQRLNKLLTSLGKFEKFLSLSLEEFLEDDIAQDVVEYNLFICINIMIDIATHIVVENGFGNPETMGGAFDILKKEKYLTADETKTYKNMVGLRNILAHEYLKINKKIIYDILQNNLTDIKKFVVFINDNFIIE